MRYVIDGFLQTKLIDNKITERERKLLEFINFVAASPRTIRNSFDGVDYMWIKYDAFLKEYPYLEIPNTKQVGVHVKSLVAKKILKLYTDVTPRGTFTYIAFDELYFQMISSNPDNYNHSDLNSNHSDYNRSGSVQKSKGVNPKIEAERGENRTHINQPTINQPNIKKPKEKINKKNNNDTVFDFSDFSSIEKENIQDWLNYKQERKEGYTTTGYKHLRINLLKLKAKGTLVKSISHSISSNWQGIFEPKKTEIDNDDFVPDISYFVKPKGDAFFGVDANV